MSYINNNDHNQHRHHDPYAHSHMGGHSKNNYENNYQKSEYRNEGYQNLGYSKGGSGLIKTSVRKSISHALLTFFLSTIIFTYLAFRYSFIPYLIGDEAVFIFLSYLLVGAIPSIFLGILTYKIAKKMYASEKPQVKRGAHFANAKEMRKYLENQ